MSSVLFSCLAEIFISFSTLLWPLCAASKLVLTIIAFLLFLLCSAESSFHLFALRLSFPHFLLCCTGQPHCLHLAQYSCSSVLPWASCLRTHHLPTISLSQGVRLADRRAEKPIRGLHALLTAQTQNEEGKHRVGRAAYHIHIHRCSPGLQVFWGLS